MIIRPQTVGDRDAVRRLLTDAFGEARVADLADALRGRADAPAGAAFVAVDDGRPVGHVQLSRGWVDAPNALVDVLVLSPLGVAPARQRAGVGTALVARALAHADALGSPAVFLEGDPDYYSRRGFEAATPLGFARPSVRVPEPAFQVSLRPDHQPSMTGALVYNDTFWAFDCVGLR